MLGTRKKASLSAGLKVIKDDWLEIKSQSQLGNPRSSCLLVGEGCRRFAKVARRQIVGRSLEVRVIENVEEVALYFDTRTLVNFKALGKTKIRVEEPRPNQRVADHLAVVAPRPTVCCTGNR